MLQAVLESPLTVAIIGIVLTLIGGFMVFVAKQLVRKIDRLEIKVSQFVTREELDLRIERVRLDMDQQIVRQEDRITRRLDTIISGQKRMEDRLDHRIDNVDHKVSGGAPP